MQTAFSAASLAVEQEASDQDFLTLSLPQQGLSVRVSPAADSVDASVSVPSARGHKADALAVSNTFGWAVAATEPSAFVLFSLSSLHRLVATAVPHSTPALEPRLAVPTARAVDHLHFAQSDHSLIVALRDGQVLVYSLQQLVQGCTTPRHTLPPVGGSVLSVHRCPAEDSPLVLLVSTTPSPPRIINLASPAAAQSAFPPDLKATSACWSVKGKQISVGDIDGLVAQYTPEGQLKGSIPRPSSLSADYQVRAVEWLENTAWLITYALPTPDGQEPVHADQVFVVNKLGSGAYAHVKFFDPTPAFGLTQLEGKRWTLRLKSWAPFKHLLFLANKPSADLGAIAQFEQDGQWNGLVLPDASRPTLPMGENGDDVAPVGVALDLTGEAPSILVLTSQGVLVSWNVANSNAPQPYQGLVKAKDLTTESEPVAQDAGAAPSSAPAAPTFSVLGAPSSSPFAVASTASPSPFGSAPFGSSPFGTTPAFGQTPALGTTLFGAAASGSSTSPAVPSGTPNAFSTFGSSSTGASGFAGFGSAATSNGFVAAAAATPATSNRGSIFGSGSPFKAAPAFGTSEAAPSAAPFAAATTTTSAFGSSTSSPNSFGSKSSAAPATNAFGTSTSTPAFGALTAAPAFGAPAAAPTFGVPAAFGSSSAFGTATASPFGTASPSPFGALTSSNAFSAFGGASSSTNNAFSASTSGGSSGFGAFASAKPANGGSIFGSGGALNSSTSSTTGGSSTTTSTFGKGASAFGAGGSAPVFGSGSFGGSPVSTIAASTSKPSFGLRKDAFNSDDEDEDVDVVDDSGARVDEPPDLEPERTGLDLNASLKNAKSSSERVAEKASLGSAGGFGTASSDAFGMGTLGLGGSTTPTATTPKSETQQLPIFSSAAAASPSTTSPVLLPTPTPKPPESPAASPSPPAAPVSFKSAFGGFGSAPSSNSSVGFGFGFGSSAPSTPASTAPVSSNPAPPKQDFDTQSTLLTESKPIATLSKTPVSTPASAKSLFGFASSPPSTPSLGESFGEGEGNSLLSRLGRIEADQDEEGEDDEDQEEAFDEEGEYEDEDEYDHEGEREDEGEYEEKEEDGDEQEENVQDDDEDGDQEEQDEDASSDAADDEQAQGTSPPSPALTKEDVKPALKPADETKPEAAPKGFAFSPTSSPPSSTPASVFAPKASPFAPATPASPAISDASSQQKSTPPTFSFHAPAAPVPAPKPSAPTPVLAPAPQGITKPPLFSGGSFSGFGSSVPRVRSPLGAPQNSAPSAAPAFSFAQAPKQAATSEATKPALSFSGFGAPPKSSASTSPLPSPLPTLSASASPFAFAAPSTPKAEPKPVLSFASTTPKESSKNAISFAPAAPKRELAKSPTFSFGARSPSSSSPAPSAPAPQLQAAQRASVTDLAPPPKLGSQLVKATEPVVKEKGMAGELAKAYLRMQTDFEIVARNTVILRDFVKAIGKPCQVEVSSSEIAEDFDPRFWSLGDLSKLRRALLDVQPGVGKLVEEAKKQKTQVAELQALMLKAETKSEEAARFIRAKDDPVFAKMVRVRQLGPEQLENQKRLRLAMTTIKATLEQVEDHVSVLREKMAESRLGRSSFKAPSLDSVNRAVRNISSAVAEKTFELDELTLRLELMRVQPASTTSLSRSKRARSASITENSMNTSSLLRASPGASVKTLSSPGTTELRPDVLATAQAALRAERSCAILKRALLHVQGPVSRLNQTASEKASLNAHENIADLQLAFSRGPITGDRLPLPRRKPERAKMPPAAPVPVGLIIKAEPGMGPSISSSSPFSSAGSQDSAVPPPPLTFKSAPQFSFTSSIAPRPSSPLSGSNGGSGVSRGSRPSSRSSAVKLRPSESVTAPESEGKAPIPKSTFDWNLPATGPSNVSTSANPGPNTSASKKSIEFVPFVVNPVDSKAFPTATTPPAQPSTDFSFSVTTTTPCANTDFPALALSRAPSFSLASPSKIADPDAGLAAPPSFGSKGFDPVQDPKALGSAVVSLQLQHGDDEDDEEYDDEEGVEDEEDYEEEQERDEGEEQEQEEDEDGEWDQDEEDEEEGLDTIVEGDEE